MPTLRAPVRGSCVITAGQRDERRRVARPAALDRQRVEVDVVAREHDLLARAAAHGLRPRVGDRLQLLQAAHLVDEPLRRLHLEHVLEPARRRRRARSTPKARHIRRSVPNWLISSGCREPLTFSNRSAGPPALTMRSTISVISRSGSTSAATRTSSPSRSSSAIHSRRSPAAPRRQSYSAHILVPPCQATVCRSASSFRRSNARCAGPSCLRSRARRRVADSTRCGSATTCCIAAADARSVGRGMFGPCWPRSRPRPSACASARSSPRRRSTRRASSRASRRPSTRSRAAASCSASARAGTRRSSAPSAFRSTTRSRGSRRRSRSSAACSPASA